MKNRTIYLFIAILLLILAIGSVANMQGKVEPRLKFELLSDKPTYKLGEPISFRFRIKNETSKKVKVLDGFNLAESQIFLEVSSDGTNFEPSNGSPGWGQIDNIGSYVELFPNQSHEISGNVLWRMSAQNAPEFRFRDSGRYQFRARYITAMEGIEGRITMETEPIQITFESPEGEDLEVWNRIKDDGNFAYLMQRNELFRLDRVDARAKFLAEVEDIIAKHPNSFYAESLRQSLSKFRESEEKRAEALRKMQKSQ